MEGHCHVTIVFFILVPKQDAPSHMQTYLISSPIHPPAEEEPNSSEEEDSIIHLCASVSNKVKGSGSRFFTLSSSLARNPVGSAVQIDAV